MDFSKYLNIPYVERGMSFDGCDCWGFLQLFFSKELNMRLPDYTEFYRTTLSAKEVQEKTILKEVPIKERSIHDIILLRGVGGVSHAGLYIGDDRMLHCLSPVGSHIAELSIGLWKNRTLIYGRLNG